MEEAARKEKNVKPRDSDSNTNQKDDRGQQFMGFPLAGGPNDDISSLLSREMLQNHMEKGRNGSHGLVNSTNFEVAQDNFLIDDIFFPFTRREVAPPSQKKPPKPESKKAPLDADSDEPIPLPYHGAGKAENPTAESKAVAAGRVLDVEEFEEEFDLLYDNAPLFCKLRESEHNRKIKMKEALANNGESSKDSQVQGGEAGFFGANLNPFSSANDKDINEDFLMTDFENLLKRKP